MKAADLPLYYNAVDILERNLAERSDKVALHSRERKLTFGEMAKEVNRVGNALKKLDVRVGEVVGVLSVDGAEWVASYFGAIKIGAVAASLNTLLTPREYAYMLRDSRARVLIVHEAMLPKIEEVRDELTFLEHLVVIGEAAAEGAVSYASWIAGESPDLEAAPTHRDDFCCLNYSSGTTGDPKGILHAHKDLPLTAQLVGQNVLGLTEADRTFAVAKLFFTFGTGGNLIFPWYCGASVVLFSGAPRKAASVLEVIAEQQPTVFYTAPTSYASILAQEGFTERYDLSSVRLCVSAGEALPAPVWEGWKAATGHEIIDGIGSTEVYHIFLCNRPGEVRPGSSGTPVPGYEVKIVDDAREPVKPGDVGTLLVKGETTALFYLHQYERSKNTFAGQWLDTGDKYYCDEDGYYFHAGRSDDMLKVGGIWVSPVEVESAVASHEAVIECAVIGAADASELIKPKAYAILKDGVAPDAALEKAIISHCASTMAPYKRPRWVVFVDELPKTATGKIQRFQLRKLG